MKVLIINAIKPDLIKNNVLRFFNSQETEIINLENKNIKPCLGCFSCWIQTPGSCILKDDAGYIYEKIMNSDLVIFTTSVVFGGYSSMFKRLQDRLLPVIMPYVKKVKGETHHTKRYHKYPKVIVIGLLDEDDSNEKELFEQLITRNSLNWHNGYMGGSVCLHDKRPVGEQFKKIFKGLGLDNE